MVILTFSLYILALSYMVICVEIPKRGWVSEELGLLVEPDNLIIHYDRVVYHTIGLRFALLPTEDQFDSKEEGKCKIGTVRRAALDNFNKAIKEFFKTIPNHFSEFTDHYCTDGTLDCYLHVNMTTPPIPRDKRQVFAAIIAAAGLTAVGTGLYHLMSELTLTKHLEHLDNHIKKTENWILDSSKMTNQYQKVSESLYTKLYHGIVNNEELLAKNLCEIKDEETYASIYLQYTLFLESYKDNFLKAMDGKVTDYLIGYDFLTTTLLARGDFDRTAYKVDPGLFYLASTCMLTRIDTTNNIAYFTITTPILQEMDVSPLYRIYNLGWWESDNLIKMNVPQFAYFLSDKDRIEVATPNLDRCRKSSGVFLCNLKDSQLSRQSNCMTDLILNQEHKSCSMLVQPGQRICTYLVTKGGVFLSGCPHVSKMSTFRGIPRAEEIGLQNGKSTFLPYKSFKQLAIGPNVVSSRGTYIIHKSELNISRPATNLTDILHLIIPGIEQDLSSLRKLREQSKKTTEGFVKDLISQHTSNTGWFWYLIGTLGILNMILLFKNILTYLWGKFLSCMNCKEDKNGTTLSELLERRSRM